MTEVGGAGGAGGGGTSHCFIGWRNVEELQDIEGLGGSFGGFGPIGFALDGSRLLMRPRSRLSFQFGPSPCVHGFSLILDASRSFAFPLTGTLGGGINIGLQPGAGFVIGPKPGGMILGFGTVGPDALARSGDVIGAGGGGGMVSCGVSLRPFHSLRHVLFKLVLIIGQFCPAAPEVHSNTIVYISAL